MHIMIQMRNGAEAKRHLGFPVDRGGLWERSEPSAIGSITPSSLNKAAFFLRTRQMRVSVFKSGNPSLMSEIRYI